MESACTAQGGAPPRRRSAPRKAVPAAVPGAVPAAGPGSVGGRDLRGTAQVRVLRFPAGDRVVVSGLPGSGKSTLIRRVVADGAAVRIDSQDMRERWERRMPARLPYAVYRPLVRIAHYLALRRALASDAGVVVHDCGAQGWVRRWLARDARRRGRAVHLLLLDVPPRVALAGQAARGRGVSAYAFARHRRAVRRLVADAEAGRLRPGCVASVLLDRTAAGALRAVEFE
ncbi:ATP-binding protein [Streptomyces sp. CNQ085]|nr:AAA family ATPase [Streptomyces sp. CNQ085]MCI0385009.1 ATP-binding protein [Streptomyces sp. CNQ085]